MDSSRWEQISKETLRFFQRRSRIIEGVDPLDLTQQVLLNLSQYLNTNRDEQTTAPDLDLERLSRRIRKCVWIDALRSQYKLPSLIIDQPAPETHNPDAEHSSDSGQQDGKFTDPIESIFLKCFYRFVQQSGDLKPDDLEILKMTSKGYTHAEMGEELNRSEAAIKTRWKELRPRLNDMFTFFLHAWFFPRTTDILAPHVRDVDFSQALRGKLLSPQRITLANALTQAWDSCYDDIHEIEIPDGVLGDFSQWVEESLSTAFLHQHKDMGFRNVHLEKLKRSWKWGHALWLSRNPHKQPPTDHPIDTDQSPPPPISKKDTTVRTRKPRNPEQKEADQLMDQLLFEACFDNEDDNDNLSPAEQAFLDQTWERFQQQFPTTLLPVKDPQDIVRSWPTLLKQHTIGALEKLMRQVHWVLSPPFTASASDVPSETQRFTLSLRQEFPIHGKIRQFEIEVIQRNQMLLLGHRLLDTESLPPHDTIPLTGTLRFRRKSDLQIVLEHPVTLQLRMGKREYWVEQLPPTLLEGVPLEQMLVEWDFA